MKAVYMSLVAAMFVIAGCGGGGSSGNRAPVAAAPPPSVGTITVLIGDSVLDDIEAVLIDIREIRLLGEDGQVTITDGPVGEIDLLSLRNITELVATAEVPAGEYTKIRVLIDSLFIQETGDPLPPPVEVALPANGKIDLNPQGVFEISPGEDLVVQIDFDLARSIRLHRTGNSAYRFRPVVFIDVLDQTDNLRLAKLFGTLQEDDDAGDDAAGEESDFDLCTDVNPDPCVDVITDASTVFLLADGTPAAQGELVLPDTAHVFGRFFIGAAGGDFLRAAVVAFGDEGAVESIEGEVLTAVADDAFDLAEDDVTTTSVLIGQASLFDDLGRPLTMDIAPGQEAEAWAQSSVLATAAEGQFPAFLVQVRDPAVAEDTVAGMLIDLSGQTLTVSNDDGEFCVTVSDETDIQLISDYDGDAESDTISLVALGDLISAGVEVEAFGEQAGDCLAANLVAAEVD